MLVKDAKKKVLPELTDEWVAEVSEFETVDALRDDVRTRLDLYARVQAQMAVRDKVLRSGGRARHRSRCPRRSSTRRWSGACTISCTGSRSRRRHDDPAVPRRRPGQDQDEFVDELRERRRREAVLADLALRAVVVQEEIEATDDERRRRDRPARRAGRARSPTKVRKDLERRGVLEAVRSDIARGKALEFLVDHASVVDEDGNPVDLVARARAETDEPPKPTNTEADDSRSSSEQSEEEPES